MKKGIADTIGNIVIIALIGILGAIGMIIEVLNDLKRR